MADGSAQQFKHWGFKEDDTRIGIAGGLCAKTILALAPVLRVRPWLSIDAEGRLRDGAEGGGNLDLNKVRAYLFAAVSAFTSDAVPEGPGEPPGKPDESPAHEVYWCPGPRCPGCVAGETIPGLPYPGRHLP